MQDLRGQIVIIANLVFEEARDRVWENAKTRRTQDL
jgi:hypothetical protein